MAQYSELTGKYVRVSSPAAHVVLVELARTPVNAIHEQYWTEFGHIFDVISQDPGVRAVVVASALPKVFSAGIDFKGLATFESAETDPARRALHTRSAVFRFRDAAAAAERCPYPVIAAVHGVTYGLGIEIISACDVRYAAEDTRFAIKEVTLGITSMAQQPKITGNQSLVNELTMTGREFSAAEAERMGFVSRVVPGGRAEVVQAAIETAKLIAEKSPIAVLGTKRVLQHARDHSVRDNLEYVATWNSAMLQTVDVAAAMEAVQKKQKPKFANLTNPAVKAKL